MSDGAEGNWPAWVQVFIATVTGAFVGAGVIIRLAFSFNNRLQRIENQDLNSIIDARISRDWHENRTPMMQVQVFATLDKIEDELKHQGQNIAILLERDRVTTAIEKAMSTMTSRPQSGPRRDDPA